jgi:hypothetical protein
MGAGIRQGEGSEKYLVTESLYSSVARLKPGFMAGAADVGNAS